MGLLQHKLISFHLTPIPMISVDILCLMYVLDPSQGVSIVRKSMYRRRNPSHVFSPVESVASMCSVYVFMCIW